MCGVQWFANFSHKNPLNEKSSKINWVTQDFVAIQLENWPWKSSKCDKIYRKSELQRMLAKKEIWTIYKRFLHATLCVLQYPQSPDNLRRDSTSNSEKRLSRKLIWNAKKRWHLKVFSGIKDKFLIPPLRTQEDKFLSLSIN